MLTTDLTPLLDQCSRTRTREHRLAAADVARNFDHTSLEWLLRLLAENAIDTLWTGSRVYGTPTPESDWDWVVSATAAVPHWRALFNHCDTSTEHDDEYGAPVGIEAALRFGPVNLLIVPRNAIEAWVTGTYELTRQRPVAREHAVETFKYLFSLIK